MLLLFSAMFPYEEYLPLDSNNLILLGVRDTIFKHTYFNIYNFHTQAMYDVGTSNDLKFSIKQYNLGMLNSFFFLKVELRL